MKNSIFFSTKFLFLESRSNPAEHSYNTDPDSWGNPYNKGKRIESSSEKLEKDPRFNKLNELGKKLSRFADSLPKDSKPYEIKSEEDGIVKVRKLLIKKENTKTKVSIFEKKSENFFIKTDYYFDTTTGKYLNGLTSVKFNEDILKNKDSNPFTLLKILPPIIEAKPNKTERLKSVSSR
jgi:hypothetical protein